MSKLVAFLASSFVAAAVLVPVAAYAYGYEPGPCEISVECTTGEVVTCAGVDSCLWRYDDSHYPNFRGFVECDGYRYTCT
ncbi:hypothetical protein JY651_45825 [Pyxidicoccus parkwayensis]|uniref:Uncharacterized protein n=1 Tax=Pyxidicoccus parkwayensis TaxID=2813578 RepID=A0ABX7NYA3_9BACT|nr:hypothetical protein [Pyxidicoccus parkwaysis]QSQ22366.1 hypothetical protein JY651_45825 [Pyxidicoccus parkwaysis]